MIFQKIEKLKKKQECKGKEIDKVRNAGNCVSLLFVASATALVRFLLPTGGAAVGAPSKVYGAPSKVYGFADGGADCWEIGYATSGLSLVRLIYGIQILESC